MVNHIHSSQDRAMKILTKNYAEDSEKVDNEIINEVEILKKIDHQNIVKIFEFF